VRELVRLAQAVEIDFVFLGACLSLSRSVSEKSVSEKSVSEKSVSEKSVSEKEEHAPG
jgi:hypothetical protein